MWHEHPTKTSAGHAEDDQCDKEGDPEEEQAGVVRPLLLPEQAQPLAHHIRPLWLGAALSLHEWD